MVCPDGEVCDAGECKPVDLCADVVCSAEQTCVEGECVFQCIDTAGDLTDLYGDGCDFYAEVPALCGTGDFGEFVATELCCACGGGVFFCGVDSDCGADEACNDGLCAPVDPCADVVCDEGYACNAAGECELIDLCAGITCPEGENCEAGECVGGQGPVCIDTAGDATDYFGDGCEYYDANPQSCGTTYDDNDFSTLEMCCACGGGIASCVDDSQCGEGQFCDAAGVCADIDLCADVVCSDGQTCVAGECVFQCVDTAGDLTDFYGDGCGFYAQSPSLCGTGDFGQFVATELCCACGGGTFSCGADSDCGDAQVCSEGLCVEVDLCADVVCEDGLICEAGECVAICEDTAGEATDSYGDDCSYYSAFPEDCTGDWDDEDFVSSEVCCACGGGSTL